MCIYNRRDVISHRAAGEYGLVNILINKLPVEIHIPGYRFCGAGTRSKETLERGDKGVNLLNEACKKHDIAYSQSRDQNKRHVADQILTQKAFQRFLSKNAGFGKKAAVLAITGIMKRKTMLGMGARRRSKRGLGRRRSK